MLLMHITKQKDEALIKAIEENTSAVLAITEQLRRTENRFDIVVHGLQKLDKRTKVVTSAHVENQREASTATDRDAVITISIPRRLIITIYYVIYSHPHKHAHTLRGTVHVTRVGTRHIVKGSPVPVPLGCEFHRKFKSKMVCGWWW